MRVRCLALIVIALLLPLSLSAPSAQACSTPACCAANCSSNSPVNQLSCCQAPAAPDRATNQARAAQHLDSIGSLTASAIIPAVSHLRNAVITVGYSPPAHLRSFALLCSRQI